MGETAYPRPAEVAGATYRTVGPGSALKPEGTPGNITLFSGGFGVAVLALAIAHRPKEVCSALGTRLVYVAHVISPVYAAPAG